MSSVRGAATSGGTSTGDHAPGHVPALDGIRAIALLLVVLFHLKIPGFRAGFVGVDVFFVLSGFLITSLLLDEIRRTGRVSLTAFWARRARRLIPGLVTVLLVVGIATWGTATDTERASIRGDLLATTAYTANWHLISTSSYFADIGIDSPLEHTWSLAIEEQFYLVWPVLVVGIVAFGFRARRGVTALALAGAAASAVTLALLWSPSSVERAYMGTDARIFEPLLGAAGAAFVASPGGRAWLARSGARVLAAGATALLVVLVSILPGGRAYFLGGAFVVSLATLALVAPVWTGSGGRVRTALSWRPLAWIGLVSYGAYLWHWPVALWTGVREPGAENLLLRQVAAAGLTFGLAAVSFYAVEKPVRSGRFLTGLRTRLRLPPPGDAVLRRTVITLAAVPITLLGVAGVSILVTTVPAISADERVVMVVGDSVPARLSASLDRAFTEEGWRFVNAAIGGCPPSGETPVRPDGTLWPGLLPRCRVVVPRRQDALIHTADPDVIVWWDRFSVSGFLADGGSYVPAGSSEFWSLRLEGLDTTVRRLASRGAVVVFVGTEPPAESVLDRCPLVGCVWPRFQIEHYRDLTTPWNSMLEDYAGQHPDLARFISVTDIVCEEDVAPCDDRIDGITARGDGIHYEGMGEKVLIDGLLERLRPILGGIVSPSGSILPG